MRPANLHRAHSILHFEPAFKTDLRMLKTTFSNIFVWSLAFRLYNSKACWVDILARFSKFAKLEPEGSVANMIDVILMKSSA